MILTVTIWNCIITHLFLWFWLCVTIKHYLEILLPDLDTESLNHLFFNIQVSVWLYYYILRPEENMNSWILLECIHTNWYAWQSNAIFIIISFIKYIYFFAIFCSTDSCNSELVSELMVPLSVARNKPENKWDNSNLCISNRPGDWANQKYMLSILKGFL